MGKVNKKGIKQTWLSEQLGKSYNMVNSYVQNRQQPRLEVLNEIAKILDVDVVECKTQEECELEIVKHHYQIDYDNCNTDLSEEEYIKIYKVNDLQFYDNYDYEIC
jgi:transcriptional regulator with XRE-family HTH domain